MLQLLGERYALWLREMSPGSAMVPVMAPNTAADTGPGWLLRAAAVLAAP